MSALLGAELPSTLASTVRLLVHPRPGLATPDEMPHLAHHLNGVRVSEAWLAHYLRCTGGENWPTTRLPPLALQIAAAPLHMALMAKRNFPFRPLGIVHQSQHIEQWRVLKASARYDLHVFTSEAREERRGISFGLVTEARDEGALVWRSEVRVLSLHRKPDKVKHQSHSHEAETMATPTYVENVFVPEATGRDYARIASDYNPVHVHRWLARLFGFQYAIAHGTWTLARALFLTGLPESPRYTLDARFLRPVDLPSTITVRNSPAMDDGEQSLLVSSHVGGHALIRAIIRSIAA